MTHIQDLFDEAGGTTRLGAALGVHAFTVEAWRKSGIPVKYWEKLFKLYQITPAELFSITKAARERVKNPKRAPR